MDISQYLWFTERISTTNLRLADDASPLPNPVILKAIGFSDEYIVK